MMDLSLPVEFDIVKEKILFKLINRMENELLLKYMPCVPFLDLAAVFFVKSEINDEDLFVTNVYLRWWKVGAAELLEIAKANLARAYPPMLYRLRDIICRIIFSVEARPLYGRLSPNEFYVLMNKRQEYGGSYLMFEKYIIGIFENIGEPYYIIPLDIDKFIIIPQRMKGDKALNEIVYKLNRHFNKAGGFLSNNCYLVNGDGICVLTS